MKIRLTVNGAAHALDVPPWKRLLDVLREDLGLTGAKEGCGEGECGACSVLLDGELVNACLVPAFQADGRRVTTAEGLGAPDDPDPVQAAFVREGGVQCGFCIPGMVMAARALLDRDPAPDRPAIRAALSGNICRCTGYEKIVRAVETAAAAERAAAGEQAATLARRRGERLAAAVDMEDAAAGDAAAAPREAVEDGTVVYRPADLPDALAWLARHGEQATVTAGATDLLPAIHAGAPAPRRVLDVSRLDALRQVAVDDDAVVLGGGVTFAVLATHPEVRHRLPALAVAAAQVGAPAIQNRATLAGNLVNGSPSADSVPPLLALDASVLLVSATGKRTVPLDGFYLGYRETVRRPDELVAAVRVPAPAPGTVQRFVKTGPRAAQSIAKVSLALAAQVAEEPDGEGRPRRVLRAVRLAAGAVAPTVVLLRETMAYLEGKILPPVADGTARDRLAREAGRLAAAEIAPIDDVRSTARYRRAVTARLVARLVRELGE